MQASFHSTSQSPLVFSRKPSGRIQTTSLGQLCSFLFSGCYLWSTTLLIFVFILGRLNFSILWCIVITAALNSSCQVLLKRKIRSRLLAERLLEKKREQLSPSPETCEWLNTILSAVYGNHHKYISHLFIRFANPLLQKLCTPPPIETVSFHQLDVGINGPKLSKILVQIEDSKTINFDFTVNYSTDFNGIVSSRLRHSPDMAVNISNLNFECRMRFKAEFLTDKFPFLSALGWTFLEKPSIDISVKKGGFPEVTSITEHFLELVEEEMYQKIGVSNRGSVTGKFIKYASNNDLEGQTSRCIESFHRLVKEMIKHGELVAASAPFESSGGMRGAMSRAMRKINKKTEPIAYPSYPTTSKQIPTFVTHSDIIPVPVKANRNKLVRSRSTGSSNDLVEIIISSSESTDDEKTAQPNPPLTGLRRRSISLDNDNPETKALKELNKLPPTVESDNDSTSSSQKPENKAPSKHKKVKPSFYGSLPETSPVKSLNKNPTKLSNSLETDKPRKKLHSVKTKLNRIFH